MSSKGYISRRPNNIRMDSVIFPASGKQDKSRRCPKVVKAEADKNADFPKSGVKRERMIVPNKNVIPKTLNKDKTDRLSSRPISFLLYFRSDAFEGAFGFLNCKLKCLKRIRKRDIFIPPAAEPVQPPISRKKKSRTNR